MVSNLCLVSTMRHPGWLYLLPVGSCLWTKSTAASLLPTLGPRRCTSCWQHGSGGPICLVVVELYVDHAKSVSDPRTARRPHLVYCNPFLCPNVDLAVIPCIGSQGSHPVGHWGTMPSTLLLIEPHRLLDLLCVF